MRLTPCRLVAAVAALLAGLTMPVPAQERPAPASPAQQPPPADPNQPAFRAGINAVRVDVIVSDKQGNPVADLKQTDFEVFEDNKPQTVETFRLVKIDQTTVPSYTLRPSSPYAVAM